MQLLQNRLARRRIHLLVLPLLALLQNAQRARSAAAGAQHTAATARRRREAREAHHGSLNRERAACGGRRGRLRKDEAGASAPAGSVRSSCRKPSPALPQVHRGRRRPRAASQRRGPSSLGFAMPTPGCRATRLCGQGTRGPERDARAQHRGVAPERQHGFGTAAFEWSVRYSWSPLRPLLNAHGWLAAGVQGVAAAAAALPDGQAVLRSAAAPRCRSAAVGAGAAVRAADARRTPGSAAGACGRGGLSASRRHSLQLTVLPRAAAAAALGAAVVRVLRGSLHRLEHSHLPHLPRGRHGAAAGAHALPCLVRKACAASQRRHAARTGAF